MDKIIFFLISILLVFMVTFIEHTDATEKITMTIVYDNYPFEEGLTTDWGFACFICYSKVN